MNTRYLLTAILTAFAVGGCSQPIDSPVPNKESKTSETGEVKNAGLSIAPQPHKPGEARPLPPTQPWKDRFSKKPWSELIIGKWLEAGRGFQGQNIWEFTRAGKLIRQYSYPAAPNHPKGIEGGTQEYKVNGNVLFPTSTYDDGMRVTESTTFIESLTENELVIYAIRRTRLSLEDAKQEAARRKIPLEMVLSEWREERTPSSTYVRLKDK